MKTIKVIVASALLITISTQSVVEYAAPKTVAPHEQVQMPTFVQRQAIALRNSLAPVGKAAGTGNLGIIDSLANTKGKDFVSDKHSTVFSFVDKNNVPTRITTLKGSGLQLKSVGTNEILAQATNPDGSVTKLNSNGTTTTTWGIKPDIKFDVPEGVKNYTGPRNERPEEYSFDSDGLQKLAGKEQEAKTVIENKEGKATEIIHALKNNNIYITNYKAYKGIRPELLQPEITSSMYTDQNSTHYQIFNLDGSFQEQTLYTKDYIEPLSPIKLKPVSFKKGDILIRSQDPNLPDTHIKNDGSPAYKKALQDFNAVRQQFENQRISDTTQQPTGITLNTTRQQPRNNIKIADDATGIEMQPINNIKSKTFNKQEDTTGIEMQTFKTNAPILEQNNVGNPLYDPIVLKTLQEAGVTNPEYIANPINKAISISEAFSQSVNTDRIKHGDGWGEYTNTYLDIATQEPTTSNEFRKMRLNDEGAFVDKNNNPLKSEQYAYDKKGNMVPENQIKLTNKQSAQPVKKNNAKPKQKSSPTTSYNKVNGTQETTWPEDQSGYVREVVKNKTQQATETIQHEASTKHGHNYNRLLITNFKSYDIKNPSQNRNNKNIISSIENTDSFIRCKLYDKNGNYDVYTMYTTDMIDPITHVTYKNGDIEYTPANPQNSKKELIKNDGSEKYAEWKAKARTMITKINNDIIQYESPQQAKLIEPTIVNPDGTITPIAQSINSRSISSERPADATLVQHDAQIPVFQANGKPIEQKIPVAQAEPIENFYKNKPEQEYIIRLVEDKIQDLSLTSLKNKSLEQAEIDQITDGVIHDYLKMQNTDDLLLLLFWVPEKSNELEPMNRSQVQAEIADRMKNVSEPLRAKIQNMSNSAVQYFNKIAQDPTISQNVKQQTIQKLKTTTKALYNNIMSQ